MDKLMRSGFCVSDTEEQDRIATELLIARFEGHDKVKVIKQKGLIFIEIVGDTELIRDDFVDGFVKIINMVYDLDVRLENLRVYKVGELAGLTLEYFIKGARENIK